MPSQSSSFTQQSPPGTCWHPSSGSQLSTVQSFLSSQLMGRPPAQEPSPLHCSATVHGFESLHGVPEGIGTISRQYWPLQKLIVQIGSPHGVPTPAIVEQSAEQQSPSA